MPSVRELTDEQRRALAGLQAVMRSELLDIWDQLDTSNVDELLPVLDAVLGDLYAKYGPAAGSLAADFYDELRDLAGPSGRFTPILAVLSDTDADDRFAVLSRKSVGPLFGAEPDRDSAFTQLLGGLQMTVMDVHRDTIMGSSVADSASRGWQRVGVGHNCGFCNMLIGRGAVYKESTVKFGAHDHCNCQAVPTFDGTPNYYSADDVSAYRKTVRRISDSQKAATRRWMADNGY